MKMSVYSTKSGLAIVLILCISISCISERNAQRINTINLQGHPVKLQDDISVNSMVYINDTLMIFKSFSNVDKLCAIKYNPKNDTSFYFLRKGKGPCEVINSRYKVIEDTLIILSYNSATIDKMIKVSLGSLQNEALWKITNINLTNNLRFGQCFDISVEGDIYIVGGSWGDKCIISKISNDLVRIAPVDYWPKDEYSGSVIPKQMVYTSKAYIYNSGEKLFYSSGEGRFACIINMNNRIETDIYSIMPEYNESEDHLNYDRKSTSYLGIQAFATDKYIYLSFNDTKMIGQNYHPSDYKGYPPYYNDKIEVYNWDGNYICTYQTECPFQYFYVTDHDTTIYTLGDNINTGMSTVFRHAIDIH